MVRASLPRPLRFNRRAVRPPTGRVPDGDGFGAGRRCSRAGPGVSRRRYGCLVRGKARREGRPGDGGAQGGGATEAGGDQAPRLQGCVAGGRSGDADDRVRVPARMQAEGRVGWCDGEHNLPRSRGVLEDNRVVPRVVDVRRVGDAHLRWGRRGQGGRRDLHQVNIVLQLILLDESEWRPPRLGG